MKIFKLFSLVFFTFISFTALNCAELEWYNGKWPHEISDLEPDPKITFGKLDNKIRYAIIPNKLPTGRVTMYLNMQVGSLMEEDFEKGFAHFVEHMAFNGSDNFPAGSLIPFFQENGMSFGGDTNAHTSLAETIYKLNLSKIDNKSLDTGLLILKDFAAGMTIDENEVKNEIGIILSEKNVRENESMLARKERMELLYNGTKFQYDVIGTEETIKSANKTNLTNFYKKWYRPENMIIIVVGDVDKLTVEEKIIKIFKDIKNDTQKPEIKNFGEVKTPELQIFFQKRPIDSLSITISTMHDRIFYPDNKKNLKDLFISSLASYMFNQRLNKIGQDNPTLWSVAKFQDNSKKGLLPSANLIISTDEENWENAMFEITKQLNSALKYGFSEEELNDAKKIITRNLEKQIKIDDSRQNSEIADNFAFVLNSGKVYTSSKDDKKLFDEFSPNITIKNIHEAFKNAFAPKNKTIFVSGKANITKEDIKTTWDKANKQKSERFESEVKRNFPYLELPKKVSIMPNLNEKELGKDAPKLYFATYKDTLDIYLIPTKYEENKVMVSFIFGNNEPFGEKEMEIIKISSSVLLGSGIGDLSPTEVSSIFGGKGIAVSEGFLENSSIISGSSTSNDLSLLLQAIWTQYIDPSPKQSSYEKTRQALKLNEYNKENTVDGVDKTYTSSIFYGKSNRFTPINVEIFDKYSLKDIANFVKNQRNFNEKAKIIITGDFDINETLKNVIWLFGEKSNIKKNEYDTNIIKASFPKDTFIKKEVNDKVDKSIIYKAFRKDLENIHDRETVTNRNIIATVIKDRMRQEIREKLAIAYSPSAYYKSSINLSDNGYGILFLKVDTQTKNNDLVIKKMDEILENLKNNGIKKEEIERLKKPIITSWKTNREKNILWHRLIQNEIIYGYPFVEWQNNYINELNDINIDSLNKELKEILDSISTTYIIVSNGTKDEK